MIEVQHNGAIQHILVHPNQSLTPAQFWLAFAALAFITLALAVMLAFLGFWLVVPVALIHLGIVWTGFYLAWRRSERVEFLRFDGDSLTVGDSSHGELAHFKKAWVRLLERQAGSMEAPRLYLASHGQRLEVGRDVGPEDRKSLLKLMRQALDDHSAP
jgi:uncharacterized membrane protein